MNVPASQPTAAALDWRWFLLSLDGRIGRRDFLMRYILPLLLLHIAAASLDSALDPGLAERGIGGFQLALVLLTAWTSIAVAVKRWHDRDKSGWWQLIMLVPVVGFLWAFVETWLLRGTVGANRFGADPLAAA